MRKFLYILAGLLYFVFPVDLLPDFFGLLGRVDDLLVAAFLFWHYRKVFYRKLEALKAEFQNEQQEKQTATSDSARIQNPHEVLGVQPNAGPDEIRTAYKNLVKRYHPDMVSHLGEEFQQLAHEKMLAIQEAYEKLSAGKK